VITQAESGLTSDQYTAIQAATGDLSVALTLQRYGPVWASHDTSATRSGELFDAAIASTYLLRAYVGSISDVEVESLASESGGDEAWTSITCNLSDVDTDVPPSLITSGTTARLFYYSTDGKIYYTECADITSDAFGAAVEVGEVGGVIAIAAVSTTKAYYVTEDATTYNRRFHVYEYDASWTSTSSEIYWPFPIHGFDAVAYTDFDLLVMASDLPPLVGSRAVGTEVTTEVNAVQGIVTFRIANDRWSDHELIDVIDRIEVEESRTDLRLSFVNSTLFATYTRAGGVGDHTYTKLAVTCSKDGLSWEFPEFVDEDVSAPAVLLPRDDYLYVVGVDATYRSPCCAWAGQTPVELSIDDNVTAIESQAAEVRATNLALANVDDELAGTLAQSDDRVQAVYDLGYVTGGEPLRIQISVEDVVSRGKSEQGARENATLSSQDRLGRLNRTVSDHAAEWPGQQAGRDPYNDPTGTGYGGLRHTAPYEGSWKAQGGILELVSRNKEGLAVSTFVADALNGSIRTGFKLTYTDKGEYAGVAFRVHDKDNFYYAAYYADDDVIRLKKVSGGEATTLAASAAMSWTINGTNWYYLWARVCYGQVYVYTSTDGITWTALSWDSGSGELSGFPSTKALQLWSGVPIVSGRFGTIGYGYAEEETWDWEPTPWDPVVPDVLPDVPSVVVAWSKDQVAVTEDFDSSYPAWTDITPSSMGHVWRVWQDASDGYAAWLLAGWASTDDTEGLYYTDDIRIGDWTLVATQQAFSDAATAAGGGNAVVSSGCPCTPGVFCAVQRANSGQSAVFMCSSSGITNTWWSDDLTWEYAGSDGEGTYEAFHAYIYSTIHTQSVVFWNGSIYIGGRGTWNPDAVVWSYNHAAYIVSSDMGSTWTVHTEQGGRYSDGKHPEALAVVGGHLYAIWDDQVGAHSVVDLPSWTEVWSSDESIWANYSACGTPPDYHPCALFTCARETGEAADKGYIWRDGHRFIDGDTAWADQDVGGAIPVSFTPWPKGADRGCLVYHGGTSDPPIVKWVKGGSLYDKTGNLLTALSGSWSGRTSGADPYDNARSLLFY